MMSPKFALALMFIVSMSACMFRKSSRPVSTSTGARDQSSNGREQPGDSNSQDSALADAAAKVTDACTLMPAAFVQKLAPGASEPQTEQYPRRCTVSNGKSALQLTIETGITAPVDPVNGAEFIPGLGLGGYLERLDPHSRGDIYLTVILGKDPPGLLHVEIAGHDGQDHKDDAIQLARAVLTRLSG